MARLVVVGLPGVGKSSLVASLAVRWDCLGVDTDDLLAAKVTMSAAQFLRARGEPAFRDVELEVLRDALAGDTLVATGAGVVLTAEARELLARELTLWLDCPDDELLARLEGGDRPLMGDDHAAMLRRLRAERAPWYHDVARVRIDASGTPDDVVARVLEYRDQVPR